MEREQQFREIERCLGALQSDLKALEATTLADESVIRELTQITDDIEGHIRASMEPWVGAVTD
jgi:hypothetical protein